jgi:hypothetical protein
MAKCTLTDLERLCLKRASEWLAYDRSPQAAIDRRKDAERRAKADRAVGHLPTCSLTKCDPICGKGEVMGHLR